MTRCIHCTRCVRFSTEVAGVDDIGLLGRGENAEITTYLEKTIDSELSGNVIDLCPVGALTSKPYAFKSRPWELNKTETYDVFDGIGSSIRIDTRGKKVLRALPRVNEETNEEWISDKSRFAIDGLSRQRLDSVYTKKNGRLQKSSWDSAISLIKKEIIKRNQKRTVILSGKFTDIETIYSSKKFCESLGSNYFDCRFDNAQFIENSPDSYKFNSTIQEIENADSILLVGSNPRWEAAVLNARIRKAYIENNCKIGLIGPKIDLTYKYEHLSDSLEHLNQLNGNSEFGKILKNSKNPLIILGASAINNKNGSKVLQSCAYIAKKIQKNKDVNPLNILNQDVSRVGALELKFFNREFDSDYNLKLRNYLNKNKPVVFLMSLDEIDLSILKDSFVIYMGHNGDKSASVADIILPTPAYTEKSSTYMNIEGRVFQTTKCHNPLGESKDEWKIFRALSETMEKELKFNNLSELRNEIISNFSQLALLNEVDQIKKISFGKFYNIENTKIKYNIENFYMNDSISRSSETMALCTKDILSKVA